MEENIEDASTTETPAEAVTETVAAEPTNPAVPSFDRPAVEAKVKDRLAALFSGDEETATEETATEETVTEEQTPATDETDGDDATEASEEEVADEASQDDKGAAATAAKPGEKPAATATSTLPAAYVRALKADEWTDEEIETAAKSPGFVAVAAKIHARRNAETAKWAEAGRQAKAASATQQGAQQEQPQTFTAIKPVDAAKLKEHYGEDALIDSIVGPINAVVSQINAVLPQVREMQQTSEHAKLETLGRQIEGFFGGKELEPFKEVYGSAETVATNPAQIEARNKVLEMADALVVGAKLQGRQLSLGDALQLAHDSVSGGFKTQAVRKEIKGALQKRARGITLKPASRGVTTPAGKAGTRSALESKVKAGLAKVFG